MGEYPERSNMEGTRDRKVIQRYLFRYDPALAAFENIKLQPIRPFPVISDFVTGEMRIENLDYKFPHGSISKVNNAIDKLLQQYTKYGENFLKGLVEPDVALLDLLYLKVFFQVYLKKSNRGLNILVEALAKVNGRIPQLTYEDLVLINPLDLDPRTFFKGKIGQSELDFYRGHNVIEQQFEEAVLNLVRVLDMCDTGNIDHVHLSKYVGEFHAVWGNAMRTLREFHNIDRKDFMDFRKSFVADDESQFRGASGAFSAGIPLLDIYAGIDSLDKSNPGYLDEHMHLYSRDGQIMIQEARERLRQNKSLKDYVDKYEIDGLRDIYETTLKGIKGFRKTHLKVVETVAPEIYHDKIAGTGDLGVEKFLKRNLDTTSKHLEEFQKKPIIEE